MSEKTTSNDTRTEQSSNPLNSLEPEMILEQLRQLNAYDDNLIKQIEELQTSMKHIREISEVKAGTEILVPITSGVFIKATTVELSDKPFLVNVGAGTVIEKNLEEVNQLLLTHYKEMIELKQRLEQDMARLQKRLDILRNMQSQGLLKPRDEEEPDHVHGPHCNHDP